MLRGGGGGGQLGLVLSGEGGEKGAWSVFPLPRGGVHSVHRTGSESGLSEKLTDSESSG